MRGRSSSCSPSSSPPQAQCIYVVFIILSTWAILSILTAVVSEKMIKTTQAEQSRSGLPAA
eukprot:8606617-Pyramimonas_sp.AAC.1